MTSFRTFMSSFPSLRDRASKQLSIIGMAETRLQMTHVLQSVARSAAGCRWDLWRAERGLYQSSLNLGGMYFGNQS